MSAIKPCRELPPPRSASVSSMRRMNRPPLLRAHKWLKKAVRAFPKCSEPVGLGAKRVMTGGEPKIADISQDCTYSSRISGHETATTRPRIDLQPVSRLEFRDRRSARGGGHARGEP